MPPGSLAQPSLILLLLLHLQHHCHHLLLARCVRLNCFAWDLINANPAPKVRSILSTVVAHSHLIIIRLSQIYVFSLPLLKKTPRLDGLAWSVTVPLVLRGILGRVFDLLGHSQEEKRRGLQGHYGNLCPAYSGGAHCYRTVDAQWAEK